MSKLNLNNKDHRNRGVEVILAGGKKKQSSHPFHIIFEKMISVFKRELIIYFEFSLKSRKIK